MFYLTFISLHLPNKKLATIIKIPTFQSNVEIFATFFDITDKMAAI